MTGHKKVMHAVPVEQLTFLKPEKLGRHYHKVPSYIKELAGTYSRVIADHVLGTYKTYIEMKEVHVQEHFTDLPLCHYRSAIGKMGFSIDRPLLTELLESYYGGTTPSSPQTLPVSTSEQRIRERLGMDVARICARILLGGTPLEDIDASVSAYEEINWGYRIELVFFSLASATQSSVYLYLDAQVADELTHRLTNSQPETAPEPTLQRIYQLPVTLDCVLASVRMPLASLLALEVEDILMIRLLDRCEVHIQQQKLFYGAISENEGSLCLTSLDSVKNQ